MEAAIPDRHEDILRVLDLRERMTVAELAARLGVSDVTVRKDLSVLEEQGQLVRTRGGARLAQDRLDIEHIDRRLGANQAQKRQIALRANALIRDGETIFLDSGSTSLALAQLLVDRDLRVVTNSLDVLNALSSASGIVLHGIGGSFRADARSFIGPLAAAGVARFHIDRAFLGTSGVGKDGTMSSQNTIESETKRAAIRQSARVIILADASKIGRKAFSIFAGPDEIHFLVTCAVPGDRRAAPAELESFGREVPFEVLVADSEH